MQSGYYFHLSKQNIIHKKQKSQDKNWMTISFYDRIPYSISVYLSVYIYNQLT